MLEVITIPAQKTNQQIAEKTLICLHGLGANGDDLVGILPFLNLNKNINVILPNAPILPVTINQNLPMPAWYDIKSLERVIDFDDLSNGISLLKNLYDQELKRGVLPENILWLGFSQGGAMAMVLGSMFACAGVVALSGYYPLAKINSVKDKSPPFLLSHGEHDQVVGIDLAIKSRDLLIEAGYLVDWQAYQIEHTICPDQLEYLANWLIKIGFNNA